MYKLLFNKIDTY